MPDGRTTTWLRAVLGRGAEIGDALTGGVTSQVRAVDLPQRRYVLKQVSNTSWLAERPDVVGYEARVLGHLASTSIPVPGVVAVDPHGSIAGVPSIVLERVPGRPAGDVAGPEEWLPGLAEVSGRILRLEPPSWVRSFTRYLEPLVATPPGWSHSPEAWQRAIEIVSGEEPEAPTGLIHRDFHPWNTLWDGEITGVVDWSQTSVGPIAMDAAHCRANLAIRFDPSVAHEYRDLWESITGAEHHPYWDLVTCVDFLPDWRPSDRGNARLDAWVGKLVAEIG